MNCPKCGNIANKNGNTKDGKQKYRCRTCKHNFERPKEGEILELNGPTEQAIGLTGHNSGQSMTSGLLLPQNVKN